MDPHLSGPYSACLSFTKTLYRMSLSCWHVPSNSPRIDRSGRYSRPDRGLCERPSSAGTTRQQRRVGTGSWHRHRHPCGRADTVRPSYRPRSECVSGIHRRASPTGVQRRYSRHVPGDRRPRCRARPRRLSSISRPGSTICGSISMPNFESLQSCIDTAGRGYRIGYRSLTRRRNMGQETRAVCSTPV